MDRIQTVAFKIPHYRRDFEVKLTSTLDSAAYDESWGVRNFSILANYNPEIINVVADEFNAANFKASTDNWTIVGAPVGKEFTDCGTAKLFGGYNTFGRGTVASKTYAVPNGHYGVIVNFDLWFLDSIDANDFVELIVDGQNYKFNRPNYDYYNEKLKLCGYPGYSETITRASIFIPHRANALTLSFKATIDEAPDNESFGIVNLRILTQTCTTS